ncbi:MAG: DUF2807 domain-containing protein [Prevotella sp.]|nr:DUF2807 domain-containing protein [Prevotella sp.]
MKTKQTMMLAALVLGLFASCISANDAKKSSKTVESVRKVAAFDKIISDALGNIHYTQGDSLSVKIVGNEAYVRRIQTACTDSVLVIRYEKKNKHRFSGNENVDIYITTPHLTAVELKGIGDFRAPGRLSTESLLLSLSGVGDAELADVSCRNFVVTASGTGDIEVQKLSCEASDIDMQGIGDMRICEQGVGHTKVSSMGVGNVSVEFRDCGTAVCRANGVGDISLSGHLKRLEKSVGNIGSFRTKGLSVQNP